MTEHAPLLFSLTDTPLPEAALRAPLQPLAASEQPRHADPLHADDLAALLEPIISASIARKARQRRYTP